MDQSGSKESHKTKMVRDDDDPSSKVYGEQPCQRKILEPGHIQEWLQSQAHRDFQNFIKQLNNFAAGVHDSKFQSRDEIEDLHLRKVMNLLDHLSNVCDEIQPIQNDNDQRFGNKAFRIWFDRMLEFSKEKLVEIFGQKDGKELSYYLCDSFGNKVRIDYGTGHEMCFIVFLMGIYKLCLIPKALKESNDDGNVGGDADNGPNNIRLKHDVYKSFSQQLLTLFALVYMPLVRKIQLRYSLEPAGSHGAFSLDDFQFMPFYFGSAQLIDHPTLRPASFPEKAVAEQYKNRYIFYDAVAFIHQVKHGPFAEHSNQLWNISGVQQWEKINSGLFKMYMKEYLTKFPIVQHLYFGPRIFVWDRQV